MELEKTLDALCRACSRAAEALSLEEACSGLVHAAREALGCRTVVLMRLTDHSLRLKVAVHRGLSDHFAYHFRPDLNENPTLSRVVRGGEMIRVDDSAADPGAMADLRLEHDAGSVLAAPVQSGRVGLGCFICDAAEPRAFDPNAVTLCRLLAHLVAACYDWHTLREQQRHLVITDPETGSYALDFFCSRLGEEIARAERYGRGLSLMVLEMDHLDRYEQTHGQREAAVALGQAVHLVTAHLRPGDTIGRYHRRQLAVCLPETDEAEALATAERLRKTVLAHAFAHAEPALTLSIGTATYARGDTVAALLDRGQKALYRAQLAGGNCTVSHSSET